MINVKQVVVYAFRVNTGVELARLIGSPIQAGNKTDVLIQVFIFPAPLKGSYFDRHFCAGRIFHLDQRGGWPVLPSPPVSIPE